MDKDRNTQYHEDSCYNTEGMVAEVKRLKAEVDQLRRANMKLRRQARGALEYGLAGVAKA